jgi:hypothetical protein
MPTPLEVAKSSIVAPIIFSVLVTTNTALLQRGTISTLPYKMLPKLIIIELLHFCMMWMNSFPVKSKVSEKDSLG